jgi:hypothetical protein
MNKQEFKKQTYLAPWCEVVEVEQTSLICGSPKVKPNAPGFNEDEWDNEQDIDDGDENEFE